MAKLCIQLGYLQDSNAAAHSVGSDIFYAILMIHLPARQDFFLFLFLYTSFPFSENRGRELTISPFFTENVNTQPRV